MREQLENRATTIRKLLRQQPLNGADLLTDFARQFAVHQNLEDEVILLKLDLDHASSEADTQAIVSDLLDLVDQVVNNYDPEAVQAVLDREQRLAEKVRQQNLAHDLVLRAAQVTKTYRSSGFHLQIPQLELRLGEITGLVGENATGKTTLLRILAGDLARTNGQLQYPLFQKKDGLDWLTIKQKIAYVPQELPPWQGKLLDNLRYEAAQHGIQGAANDKAVEYILQRLGLWEHLDKSWRQLSGGYKLRFALARALVWQSQLLLIDEPLANLDVKAQLVVLSDLQNLAKNLLHPMAIVISSQHLHEIETVADQLLFMRGGKLENLGARQDYGSDRSHNTFELECPLSYTALLQQLEGFPYQKVHYNGSTFILTTNTDTAGYALLQHLAAQGTAVTYYRDLSCSVKTKFYENLL